MASQILGGAGIAAAFAVGSLLAEDISGSDTPSATTQRSDVAGLYLDRIAICQPDRDTPAPSSNPTAKRRASPVWTWRRCGRRHALRAGHPRWGRTAFSSESSSATA